MPHHPGPVPVKADELPVRVGPGTAAAGQVHDGLQQVGLSLGIFAVYDVAASVEGQLLAVVIAEAFQQQAVNLDQQLGLAAGGGDGRQLQKVLELDILRGNGNHFHIYHAFSRTGSTI